jgi:tryptophan 2,3-dioxygenase
MENATPSEKFFTDRLSRVVRYFRHLEDSFDIMVIGMEKEQFLKFRMALLPASGFQSAQYRLIELHSTDLVNLVTPAMRATVNQESVDEQLNHLYWKSGATELSSGKKTLTLQQFENKYRAEFKEIAVRHKGNNLRTVYQKHFAGNEVIIKRLREFDTLANVLWPLAHLRSAGHYLHKDPEDIKATGGTNWQKYLPPRFQKIVFFPELWSEEEKQQWGSAAFKS